MEEHQIRCMRCKGYKKLFKIGSAYSAIDTGGIKVDCPMCLGLGVVDSLENAINKIAEKAEEKDAPKIENKVDKKKAKKNDTTIESSNTLVDTER